MTCDFETHRTGRRPHWRKKRWWAAVAFWLALPIAYPASGGPSAYIAARDWLPLEWHNAWVAPADGIIRLGGLPARRAAGRYAEWWFQRGLYHKAWDERFPRQPGDPDTLPPLPGLGEFLR